MAVATRSLLAPLAAFALHGDAIAAGRARFFCILIGVTIGTTFVLILGSDRVRDLSERLLKRIGRSELARTDEAGR